MDQTTQQQRTISYAACQTTGANRDIPRWFWQSHRLLLRFGWCLWVRTSFWELRMLWKSDAIPQVYNASRMRVSSSRSRLSDSSKNYFTYCWQLVAVNGLHGKQGLEFIEHIRGQMNAISNKGSKLKTINPAKQSRNKLMLLTGLKTKKGARKEVWQAQK